MPSSLINFDSVTVESGFPHRLRNTRPVQSLSLGASCRIASARPDARERIDAQTARPVPRVLGIPPAAALLLKHRGGGFFDRGYVLNMALLGQRISACPRLLTVGERHVARLGQRHQRVAAEPEHPGSVSNDQPLHPPPRPGRVDAQVQAAAVAVEAGLGGAHEPRRLKFGQYDLDRLDWPELCCSFIMRLSLSSTPRLSLDAVSFRYGPILAVDGVSLEVAEGEIVCLLGPSGSGKSTLLRLIAGIERPWSGRVLLDGVAVAGRGTFVEPEERRVGMVFQDYALFPHLTVAANVAFGIRRQRKADVDSRVAVMLDRVGLRQYADSYPHMLSGGERQRVALARALLPGPRVLLMDEAFSSLDSRLRDRIRQDTLKLLRETRTTAVLVTHDPGEAMRLADRIALLHEGRLVECAPPEDLYSKPATLAAARFISNVNELRGVCRDGYVLTPLGCFTAPHLADQTEACVCIRPHSVRVAPRGDGVPGRVVSTSFLGEVNHVAVAVNGLAAPLTIRTPGRTRLSPDDTVYLAVDPEDVQVVAHDEHSALMPVRAEGV